MKKGYSSKKKKKIPASIFRMNRIKRSAFWNIADSGISLSDRWLGSFTRKVYQSASKEETFGSSKRRNRENLIRRIGQKSLQGLIEEKGEERRQEKHKGSWAIPQGLTLDARAAALCSVPWEQVLTVPPLSELVPPPIPLLLPVLMLLCFMLLLEISP